jgi:proteasome lid subunit RPN8/RPN11
MLRIDRSVLDAICRDVEAAHPEEACGCLAASGQNDVVCRAIPCRNAQKDLHQMDPREHPQTAREAYSIDPLELLRIQKDVDAAGLSLCGVYHSHPETGPDFSAEDRRLAMPDGEPVWPSAHYLIASAKDGKVTEVKSFTWDPGMKGFVEEPLIETPGDA